LALRVRASADPPALEVEQLMFNKVVGSAARAALLAAVGALLLACHAFGATAKLEVPRASSTKSSPLAEIDFNLPPHQWTRATGLSEGTPIIGSYTRSHDLGGGATCLEHADVTAIVLRAAQRPKLRAGVLALAPSKWWRRSELKLASHGRTVSGVEWFAGRLIRVKTFDPNGGPGPASPVIIGVASLATPSWFTPRGRPVTAVRFVLSSTVQKFAPAASGGFTPLIPSASDFAACSSYIRPLLAPLLQNLLRGDIRVGRRP
jgi:hypothetical protein